MRNRILFAAVMLPFIAVTFATAKAGNDDQWKLPPSDAPMPHRWLPVDDDGWTLLEPSPDSRLIYMSTSEGNDQTARVYGPGDPAVGPDPREPAGTVRPFKTVAAAMEKARDGMPDWVLLKRGDTWRDVSIRALNGRSGTEPSVICAYGKRAQRPLIRGRNGGVSLGTPKHGVQNAVLMDVALYCSFLDPEAADYGVDQAEKVTRGMARIGIGINGGARKPARNILVENCLIRFGGLHVVGWGTVMRNVVFRRNLVLDKYPPTGHTMGMWGAYASVLLEECIFDHNGWLLQNVPENRGKPGRAIPLSHNTYCTGMYSTIFRDNMFLRAASIGNKFTANYGPGSVRDVVVENNLYVDGEIGTSMGGNRTAPLRWVDCRVTDNVMMDLGRSRPTGRRLAWYVDATDWDGGSIAGNLFLHQPRDEIRNVRGLLLEGGDEKTHSEAYMRDVSVRGNLFHGLKNGRAAIMIQGHRRLQSVTVTDNILQFPGLSAPLLTSDGPVKSVTFRRNTYWSGAEPGQWFRLGDEDLSFEEWTRRSGEKNARREKVQFPDPTRCIETYMRSIDREPTIDAFVGAARAQSKADWRPELTAKAVNDYIRAGFGMERSSARATSP